MTTRPAGEPRVAVITGGASGFGRALGDRCAEHGLDVVVLDLDGERAQHAAEELTTAHGVETLGMALDVGHDEELTTAADVVFDRFGRADVVFSNVGVQLFGGIEQLTDEEWRWVLDVNVVGAARTARVFLPLLRQAPAGRIAFTASAGVLAPSSRLGVYQASKFALWGLAETLRLELAAEPITVSVVFPSGMLSRHLETSAAAQPDHLRRDIATEDDLAAMVASNPSVAAEITTPDEAARNVVAAVLAGARYIVTHGALVEAVVERCSALLRAAELARHADGRER
jgi:NAD(P)-dependent dehydrogenase (short-subunit alcohol dehydrogenase family)